MTDWLKKALTRKITIKTTQKRKPKTITIEPSQKLVYGIKFSIAMTICLTALEIAHMAIIGKWNSEIFSRAKKRQQPQNRQQFLNSLARVMDPSENLLSGLA